MSLAVYLRTKNIYLENQQIFIKKEHLENKKDLPWFIVSRKWGFLRILILILKVWGFLRVTLKNSQILRWEWGESGLKILRVFEGDPQKPSKFEVRMRAMFLRLRVKISRWEWGFALRVFEKFSKILENSQSGWTIKSFWNNR